MNKSIHQGEVILIPVNLIPSNAKFLENGVVQRGEISGHAHTIAKGKIYTADGIKYVNVLEDSEMIHGIEKTGEPTTDHPAINVPAGQYKVMIQEEYFPSGNQKVTD